MEIKKILLVRPDMVGDVVLITPAISLLRKKFPQAQIDLWAQKYTKDLLAENKEINEIIIKPSIKLLKNKKYDVVVHFYNELPYVLPAFLAGIPVRIGDRAKVLFGWLHNHGVWLDGGNLTLHQVEKNIELLQPLGITMPEPPPKLKIDISNVQKESLGHFLKEHDIGSRDLIVGINPGIGRTSRAWLPERYAEVADYLIEKLAAKIIITGTEKDQPIAAEIIKRSKHTLIDLTGKTTLAQLIAIISRYSLFLSADTGPLHLAAALEVPTIALFPAKSLKPSEWGPWLNRHIIVRQAADCKRRCLPKKCSYDDCLKAISAKEVISAANELLAGGGNRTLAEARLDWFQKSINILVNSEPLYKILAENGYQAVKLGKISSLSELIRLIIREDINLIHWIGEKPSFILRAAQLISSLFTAIPLKLIYEKEEHKRSLSELIAFYFSKFCHS